MGFANNAVPNLSCPICKVGLFFGSPCPSCGRTYVEAELKSKGIGPHAYRKDDSGYDSCRRCGKIQDTFIHT